LPVIMSGVEFHSSDSLARACKHGRCGTHSLAHKLTSFW
jgi:hypothetical protein